MPKKEELLAENTMQNIKQENCFSAIRYFLAINLMLVHISTAIGIEQFWPFTGALSVQGFFIITGFLVLFSFLRTDTTWHYALKRAARVLPAYLLVVVLCFLLCAFESKLSLSQYFTSWQTYKYLIANACFLNFIEPSLPGVFTENPVTAVNGSLWFMKVEVLFYICLPLFVWLLRKYNKIIVIISVFVLSIAYNEIMDFLFQKTGNSMYHLLQRQFVGQLIYFFSGSVLLVYFDILKRNLGKAFLLGILLLVLSSFLQFLQYLQPLGLALVIVGIAYGAKSLNIVNKIPNLTYGMYLFHFPIVQTLVAHGMPNYSIPLTFVLTFLLTILVSWGSYNFVEKRFANKTNGTNRTN